MSEIAKFTALLRRLRQIGPGRPPPEEVGLSPSQIALLERVASMPDCNLQDLADGLHLTPPTVSVGVRKLEEAGLLERHPDPQDGRAWQFELTEAGRDLWARVEVYRQAKVHRLLAGLTPEERQTLLTLLERALDAAEGAEGSEN